MDHEMVWYKWESAQFFEENTTVTKALEKPEPLEFLSMEELQCPFQMAMLCTLNQL